MPIVILQIRGDMKNRAALLALLFLVCVLLFQNCNNSKETFALVNGSSKTTTSILSTATKVSCPISSYPEGTQNLKAFTEASWFANFDSDYSEKYIIKWFAKDLGVRSDIESDYFFTSVADINNDARKAGKHSRKYKLTDAFGNLVCESAEIEYNYLKACPIKLVTDKTNYLVGEKVVIAIDSSAIDDQQLRNSVEYWSGKKDLSNDLNLVTGQIKNGRDTEFTFLQPGFYSRSVLIKDASGNYLCESQSVSFNVKTNSATPTGTAPVGNATSGTSSTPVGNSTNVNNNMLDDPQAVDEKATIQWFYSSKLKNQLNSRTGAYFNQFVGEASLSVTLLNQLNNSRPTIELTAVSNSKWKEGVSNNSSVSISARTSSTVLTTQTSSNLEYLTGTSTPQQFFASYKLKITCPSGTYLHNSCQQVINIQHNGYRPDSSVLNPNRESIIPSFTGIVLGASNPDLHGVCYCIPNGS